MEDNCNCWRSDDIMQNITCRKRDDIYFGKKKFFLLIYANFVDAALVIKTLFERGSTEKNTSDNKIDISAKFK